LLDEEIARGFGHKDLGPLTHLQKVERGLFVSEIIWIYLSTWQFYVVFMVGGERKSICGGETFWKSSKCATNGHQNPFML